MTRTPQPVEPMALAAGALAIASGVGALLGWQIGWDAPLRLRAAWPATPPDAALGLVGCGIAAVCAGLGRARGAGIAAACAGALVGGAALVGGELRAARWVAGSAASEAPRLPVNTAVCLLLAGGSLAVLSLGRRVAERSAPLLWLSGVVLSCFGGASLLAHLAGIDVYYGGWSQLTSMAVPAAASLMALGFAVLAVLRRVRPVEQGAYSWAGLAVGFGSALAALALWAALVQEETRHIERSVASAAASVRLKLALAMEARLDSLVRMAERTAAVRPEVGEWQADAQLYVAHDPGLEGLGWLDADGRALRLARRAGSPLDAGRVEEQARADAPGGPHEVHVAPSFALDGGGRVFAVYAPIRDAERLVGVFDVETALGPALVETAERYDFVLGDASGVLLRRVRSDASPRLAREAALALRGADWRIRIWPHPAWLADLQSGALELALGAGLALSVLAGSTVSLARTARQRLRSVQGLLESAPDAMVVVDQRGVVVLVNAETERMFGYAREELTDRSVDRLVPARLLARHRQGRERYFSRPDERPQGPLEVVARRRDGAEFPAEISLRTIVSERGTLVSTAIRDLTGRRAEELRRRLAEDLRVQRDALAAANAELARSNADLDQFAAVVSHDLKAPLRGIASLAEWLSEDHGEALGEEGREQLVLLRARAARMYRLIDGILEYSRAGRTRKPVAVDSRATALEVLDGLGPPEGIRVQVGAQLPTVIYDEAQLTQVLQNLIENAIRHLGRPTGTIGVEACEGAEDWEFCVADDGVGIPEEYRERIFRIFQTLAGEPGSTGVGLAVVKKIVESSGGRIWVAPRAGGGSEFHFTVPKRGG